MSNEIALLEYNTEVGPNFKSIEYVDGSKRFVKVVAFEDLYKEHINNHDDLNVVSILNGKIIYFKKLGTPKFIVNY